MVITFLPYADFEQSVQSLDDRRLGKQRLEAMQIYHVLNKIDIEPDGKFGWRNHPAVLMWVGYKNLLAVYHNLCLDEWVQRGRVNTMHEIDINPEQLLSELRNPPVWWGWDAFHKSHMAALIRKSPSDYLEKFEKFVGIYRDYGYIWPHKWEGPYLQDHDYTYLTAPINPRQLLDFCTRQGCKNKVVELGYKYCGVHNRTKRLNG